MTEPQPKLFVSERPVRSDFETERVYARRRVMTVVVLASLLGGGAYALWGGKKSGEIPTITAEGPYKEKPAEPGGIDIPHQNVRVYDQLEGKKSEPQVEHLLPPPETPKEAPIAASQTTPKEQPPAFESIAAPPPAAAPASPVGIAPPSALSVPAVASAPTEAANKPEAEKSEAKPKEADILPATPLKKIDTTVSVPTPAAPLAKAKEAKTAPKETPKVQEKTIEQLINDLSPKAASSVGAPPAVPAASSAPAPVADDAPPPPAVQAKPAPTKSAPEDKASAAASAKAAIQVASLPSEAQARAMMEKMQKKYAAELRGAKLRIVRADLGSKGVYYRIQSQTLSGAEANRICASLKRSNAGCIFVAR